MESKVVPAGAARPASVESHTYCVPVVREVPLLHGAAMTGGR